MAHEPNAAFSGGVSPMTIGHDLVATLKAACSDVLETPPRLDASFFDLGGDSTQVVALVGRLRSALEIHVELRDVYESHTLAELAASLENRLHHPRPSSERAQPTRSSRLPVTWSQEHVLSLQRGAAIAGQRPRPYLVGPIVYRIEGGLDLVRLGDCLDAVVDRHDALRARFGCDQEGPFQQITTRALPTLQLLTAPTVDLAAAAAWARTSRAFGLGEVPRVRAAACQLGSSDCVVAVAFDHLVVDRTAAQLILRELSVRYHDGWAKPTCWPSPPVLAYCDYIDSQRKGITDEALDRHVSFWRDRLGPHVVPAVDLPFAGDSTDRWIARASPVRGALAASMVGDLLNTARRSGSTPFCLLLTAMAGLLARYCGAPQAVTFPIANRDMPGAETLVASLFNRIVFYPRWLSAEMTWNEAIGCTWRDMNEARAHHEMPYALLTRILAGDRFGRQRSQLSVSINVVDEIEPLAIPEAQVTDIGGAQEDLNPASLDVYVIRRPGAWTIELWADHEVVAEPQLSMMLRDLMRLLTSVISDPSGRIAAIDLELAT
jgi:acyl carrier protein